MLPEGMVVAVTGGAQGIGMAISQAFARERASVWVADVDPEAAMEFQTYLRGEGYSMTAQLCDVASEDDVRATVEAIVAKEGRIDCWINNAGTNSVRDMFERTTNEWDYVIDVNLRGPYLCSRYAAPHMSHRASIINIASTRALMSEPNTEPYSASKGGLISLTHSLAVSLAARQIRVNAISPGWIDVSNWKKASTRKQAKLSTEDHEQHPVGRVGGPEDIAELCLFLADTTKSGFITGQNFVVDGGMTKKMIYEE